MQGALITDSEVRQTTTAKLLTGNELCWIAVGGWVDLYLVGLEGTEQATRHHVLRVEGGGAIFEFAIESLTWLAVPGRGASMLPILRDSLFQKQRLVNDWIVSLVAAATTDPSETTGEFGISGRLSEEREVIREELEAFHSAVGLALVQKLRRQRGTEQIRLAAQTRHERQLISTSAVHLAAPLNGRNRHVLPEAGLDPLLGACRAIGTALDIKFRSGDGVATDTTARRVEKIARASRVRLRSVLLREKWWKRDQGPLLAFRHGNPVALLPVGAKAYMIFDPLTSATVRARGAALEGFDPVAYLFYRGFPIRNITTLDVLKFGLKGVTRDLATVWLLGITAGLLGMLTPILTGVLFEDVIPSSDKDQLVQIAGVLLVTAISSTLFSLARNYAAMRAESRASNDLQAAIWDRLLDLPARFFRDYSSGDLSARAMGIDSIRQILSGTTVATIFSGLFSVVNLALLIYYSVPFALAAIALTAVSVLVTSTAGYYQLRIQRKSIESAGTLSSLVLQILQGMSKLRVARAETRAYSAWVDELSKQNTLSVRSARVGIGLAIFNAAFSTVTTIVLFIEMARLSGETGMGTGRFIAFITAFGQFYGGVSGLSGGLLSALSIIPIYERAKPLLRAAPEVTENKAHPGDLTGQIEISHVSFSYKADSPPVLRDVSISVKPGQFIAIVGASGCGKSTLLRLLLGFETPGSGGIYFDGRDLATLDLQAVRRQMGVVIQNAIILSGDIKTNILGSAPFTLEHAWEAARMAGLEADIKAMPMGMHTHIGEGGSGLSGGQRQRLMIARALVQRPKILLLDEATSALDNQSQAIVSKHLEQLKATRVVVAHRLSTIQKADRIFVLDQGVIVQNGSYEELKAIPGPFADLAKRQLEKGT